MNFNSLLNQILGAAGNGGGKQNTLLKIGGGIVAAQMLGKLMKKGGAGGLVKTGSMAALGALAYHAYQNWQQNQGNNATAAPLSQQAFTPVGQDAETAGRVILRAMIAAAAADGQIDEAEQELIAQESGDDAETRQWLLAETARPATPAELARDVGGNPALAAETYLAARLVCGTPDRKEMVFLSQLAQALQLDAALVESLEQQARSL
ncbi:uncharacterized membrane protein YebE (DUF533 family) [Neisseria sp. HSC-16F19]|nr:DUF533 domain-containing protein [Neisseria sp. HSC-16F19]MCP2040143.1 uncharacterized membrane protein YebE (DUF533 family) [Neisseria sp. HSC-16F19]